MEWIMLAMCMLIGFLAGGLTVLVTFVKPILNDSLASINYLVKISKMYLDELGRLWRFSNPDFIDSGKDKGDN